jgi:type IV pilus assembly protein PilW
MIALAIGMLGVVVVMQVMGSFDSQRRTSSGGNDATVTGAVTFYDLQRRLRNSGYGFGDVTQFYCPLTLPTGVLLPSGVALPSAGDAAARPRS